jgi:hypothetical protein
MSEPQNDNRPSKDEIREHLRRVRRGIRITKITCTRSVKGRTGDSFVGFSAAWQSVQDDHSGPGADVMAGPEDDHVYAQQGLTLKDAKLARYMLSMECDIAALESGLANGTITPGYFADASKGVKNNYEQLVLREMGLGSNGGREGSDGGDGGK